MSQLDPQTVGLVIKGQPLIAGHNIHHPKKGRSERTQNWPGIYLLFTRVSMEVIVISSIVSRFISPIYGT